MKRLIGLLFFTLLFHSLFGQEPMEKVMDQRAREMYRVIGLNSPEEWKKFIKENYTRALIDKPMQSKIEGNGPLGSDNSSQPQAGNIEAKAVMFRMLHEDFGGGKVKSIKTTGEKLEMTVQSGDMMGTFMLRFSKEKPFLIDGLGIEVGN